MKYFKLAIKIDIDTVKARTVPSAFLSENMQGAEFLYANLPNNNNKLLRFNLVSDVPVLDYFVLKESYGKSKKRYDWIELDVYGMALHSDLLQTSDWLVSEKFKNMLQDFNLPSHRFYPAKLLFKERFLNYYLFHLGEQNQIIYESSSYLIKDKVKHDFKLDNYNILATNEQYLSLSAKDLNIKSKNDFLTLSSQLWNQQKELHIKDYAYQKEYDLFLTDRPGFMMASETLCSTLQEKKITGIEPKNLIDNSILFLDNQISNT